MSGRGTVYNVYINHLLKNGKEDVSNNFTNVKFDAWFLTDYNNQNPSMSAIDLTFDEATANARCCVYLGTLNNADIETVSTVDGLESELSYESSGFLSTPVSSYLFSTVDRPTTGTMIERDIYYKTFNYSVYSAKACNYDLSKYPRLRERPDEDFIRHFSGYNFSSGYDASEYQIYGIEEEPLCEDQTNLKVDDSSFTGKFDGFSGNGILVTWYNGERATEDEANNKLNNYIFNEPKNPEDSIPCAYFQLPKAYNPLNKRLKVQWSDDGLFSVK